MHSFFTRCIIHCIDNHLVFKKLNEIKQLAKYIGAFDNLLHMKKRSNRDREFYSEHLDTLVQYGKDREVESAALSSSTMRSKLMIGILGIASGCCLVVCRKELGRLDWWCGYFAKPSSELCRDVKENGSVSCALGTIICKRF